MGTPNKASPEQRLELDSAVGKATRATGALDFSLVMIAADIVHPVPIGGPDLRLASLVVMSHTTFERRANIVRELISFKVEGLLKKKPHEYQNKFAKFVIKAFNIICDQATDILWMRNTAAHGDVVNSDPPYVIPSPLDFAATQRFHQKRGGQGPAPFFPENGLTADELVAFSREIGTINSRLMQIHVIMRDARQRGFGPELEQTIVALARDLKIQAPLLKKPLRQARQKRPPKKPHNQSSP